MPGTAVGSADTVLSKTGKSSACKKFVSKRRDVDHTLEDA